MQLPMLKKAYYFLFLLMSIPALLFAQNAGLKGTITDSKTHETLPGAYLHFDDTKIGTTTDANGNYQLTNITPGTYKVKVDFIGYDEYEYEITLTANQTSTLYINLSPSSRALKVVSVYGKLDNETEAASRSNEKNATNIKNVISAQAIAKSPDINAANVLQRVSGVTIQRNAGGDDAYPIIRGIDPRYNNTLINGVKIASPDNKSRFVSLSIVPSDLLQRIEVSKSLLPEMEGDAIGGTVNLVFKDAPDKQEFTAIASVGYNQLFIDRKFADYKKQDIHTYSPRELNGPNYAAQLSDFSRSTLDYNYITPPPNTTFTLTYGKRFLNNRLGLIIGNALQNNYYGSNSEVNNATRDAGSTNTVINDILSRQFSTHQFLNNAILHLDYRFNEKNKISVDNVLLYSKLNEAEISTDTSLRGSSGGRNGVGTGPFTYDNRSTNTNTINENLKIAGSHILTKHFLFDWNGVFSDAFVRNPDLSTSQVSQTISIDSNKNKVRIPPTFDGINKIFQHNNDKDFSGAAALSYTKSFNDNANLELKVGGLYRHKTRYNYQNTYSLLAVNKAEVYTNIYDAKAYVYDPIGSSDFDPSNYNAYENVTAYYGEFKLTLSKLDVFGGFRSENTSQGYQIVNANPYGKNHVIKEYTDLLPSLQLKYELTDKSNLRASYFKSIARPAFFDLVPGEQQTNGAVIVTGNYQLLHTTADNFDLRYELFPKNDEQIFVGTFYKKLTNPIETKFVALSGGQQVITPINTNSATVAGLELALTKYVGNFGITGNYAYTYSDVYDVIQSNIDPTQNVFQHRRLTGAAVHDLNASLLYRDSKRMINAQIAYQFLGSTLVQLYDYSGDNYIQKPQSNLALSADKGLNKHLTIFLKANNLLNTHTIVQIANFNNGNEYTKASALIGIRYNH
jgi:outer membrane receptor protein involved in Fe transport